MREGEREIRADPGENRPRPWGNAFFHCDEESDESESGSLTVLSSSSSSSEQWPPTVVGDV